MRAHILAEETGELLQDLTELAVSLSIQEHLVVAADVHVRANYFGLELFFDQLDFNGAFEFQPIDLKEPDTPLLLDFSCLKLKPVVEGKRHLHLSKLELDRLDSLTRIKGQTSFRIFKVDTVENDLVHKGSQPCVLCLLSDSHIAQAELFKLFN